MISKEEFKEQLDPGWAIAFGDDLYDEILKALKKDECDPDEFDFDEIKEKFAALRIYAHGYGDNTRDVMAKYEELSKYICGHCGKIAKFITDGWYYPFCENCIKEINGRYMPIEEFYGFDNERILEEIDNIKNNFKYEDYWAAI